MKINLIFTFLLASSQLFSQGLLLSSSVNFKKNKTELSRAELGKLDKIIDSLKSVIPLSIIIKGFTDSDADSLYNFRLSEKRCQTVSDYLVKNGVQPERIKLFPMGEDFSSNDEEAEDIKLKDRRVDVFVFKETPLKPNEPVKLKDKCDKDTMVLAGYGVFMKARVCELEKSKDCIQLRAERQVRYDLKLSRFRMKLGLKDYYKVKHKRVTYNIRYSCKDSSCAGLAATLFVPFYEVKEKKAKVEKFDSTTMAYQSYTEYKVRSIKKKQYIAMPNVKCDFGKYGAGGDLFSICCGGLRSRCICKKSKIKFKNGLKIIAVNDIRDLEENNTFMVSRGKDVLHLDPESYIRSITLLDGKDTVRIREGVEITALRHGLRRSKSCNRRWLLFVKVRVRCDYFRTYKFGRKDIDLLQRKEWEQGN